MRNPHVRQREQGGSEYVMFDSVDYTDATRVGIILASDFQRLPGVVERPFEHDSSPPLDAVGYFIYVPRIAVIPERVPLPCPASGKKFCV